MAEIVLKLFSGPQCQLCDRALDLLSPQLRPPYRLEVVDITASRELKKNYGLLIPVLRREDDGSELYWPFTAGQVEEFLY